MSARESDSGTSIVASTPTKSWLGTWETSTDPAYCRDLEGYDQLTETHDDDE